jgi:DNA gyrase subunit A
MDVNNENDLMIINKSGITIRTSVDQIPVQGRATQGVRVINLGKKNDCIGSVCKVTREVDEELPTDDAQVEQPVADKMDVNTNNE